MDDAQKRAQAFNSEQRIAELEREIARLRAALEEIRDLDPDSDYATFVRESGGIAVRALASEQ
jgi:chaperonin cofactor prefoldin